MRTTYPLSSTLDRMLTINQALDEALAGSPFGAGARGWVPALDVIERSDAYVIALELPGVDPAQVDISFEQRVLTVRGTKPPTLSVTPDADLRVFANERVSGMFERSVRLPEFVDGDRITAQAAHGVLEITVPKAQVAQPRKIEIRATQSSDRIQPPSTAKD
ncbi:MAG: Hsp20/alpha crystallin family protein [Gemmatimonadaceae bacterium]